MLSNKTSQIRQLYSLWPNNLKLLLAITLSVIVDAAIANDNFGYEIAQEADLRESDFLDFKVNLRMTLKDQRDRQAIRELDIRQLEIADVGDRSILVIREPRAIRGTALLSHAQKNREDDQWIFLPAVNRVKKIASRNKSGPFLGSDFAYEDLVSQELEKFVYSLLREELFNGASFWVVERVPVDPFSGYSRQIAWYDKEEYRIERVEYYDKHEALLKTLTLTDFRKYHNKFWKAHTMHMENVQTGKSTTLVWSNFQFANGFTAERDFSVSAIRRMR
ncbi:MAG: outer membrane lipoprotein-sorting protein [Pseudomonadota bacterium]